MNSPIKSIITIAVAVIVAVYCTVDILSTRGSGLARLYIYITVLAGFISIIRPQLSLYAIIPLSCFIDLFKRFMVIYGSPSSSELASLMSTPMIMILGATFSVFLAAVTGVKRIDKLGWLSFFLAVLLLSASVAGAVASGGGIRGLGHAFNQGIYAFLIFLIPLILDTDEKRLKYLRYCIPFFTIVALYMLKHSFFGLAQFEYDYLMTGLTQEVRILVDDGGARRYFSTMNSAATVSTMLSVVATLVLTLPGKGNRPKSNGRKFFCVLLALLFYTAAAMTLARTGIICGLASLVAYLLYGSKMKTLACYAAGAMIFLMAIFSSGYIVKYRLLDEWQDSLQDEALTSESSANTSRALVLTTMYDRLSGWDKLTEPWRFPLLGTAFGGKLDVSDLGKYKFSHDLIVGTLAKLGWIPFLIGIGLLIYALFKIHTFQFSLNSNSLAFKLVRVCMAAAGGILIGGAANGAQLVNFPQNFYFFLWLSIIVATYMNYKRAPKAITV